MIDIWSEGGGVQTLAGALMSDRGDLPPVSFAVFADPMGELPDTYKAIADLKRLVRFPILTASKGDLYAHEYNSNMANLPYWSRNPETGKPSISQRNCTRDYKIRIVQRTARIELGIFRKKKADPIGTFLGISTDEPDRIKPSRKPQLWENKYPLIDANLSREECYKYVLKYAGFVPERSSCFFCPFRSDHEWKRVRDNYPDLWERACRLDEHKRRVSGVKNDLFLWSGREPLRTAKLTDAGREAFRNECEGHCGT